MGGMMGGGVASKWYPKLADPAGIMSSRKYSNTYQQIADPLGVFQAPATPDAPITPPPAPNSTNSQGELDVAAQQQALALKRGRAATVLTSGGGLSNMGYASSTLLGQ